MPKDFASTLADLKADMTAARRELEEAIGRLPAALFDVAPRGGWSAEAVLRHVVKSELIYAAVITGLREKPPSGKAIDVQPLESPARALERLAESRRVLLATLEGVAEEEFYRLKPIGMNDESVRSILENNAMHDREHAAQLDKTIAEVSEA